MKNAFFFEAMSIAWQIKIFAIQYYFLTFAVSIRIYEHNRLYSYPHLGFWLGKGLYARAHY